MDSSNPGASRSPDFNFEIPPSTAPARVLLVKPGSLGDVVHALPVAAALHRAWPDARLTWVIDPRWEPLLAGNPAVAERLPFARQHYRGPAGLLRAVRWLAGLRHRQPDLVIDLQGLLRSALIAKATRPGRIVGLSDAREGATAFYERAAAVTSTQHAVDRYLAVLPLVGVPVPESPEFWLGPGELIEAPEDFVLLHPFARGAGKSLTDPQIVGLAERLAPRPVVLAGFGDPPVGLPRNVRDLTRRTSLAQLLFLLRRARAVISVDSGPMHMAAAVGARLLSIHTWSDPRRVGPYAADAWVWQGGELTRQDLTRPPRPEQPLTADALDAIAAWTAGS